MDKAGLKNGVGYQALLLGGFSTLATALLVAGNLVTRDAIALRQQEDLLASLSQVIPAERYTNNLLDNTLLMKDDKGQTLTIYRGTVENKVSALAYRISSQGYAGEISLILGVDASGNILGVRVLTHAETPGLGDKIEVTKDDWMLGFDGLSLENTAERRWAVKKDGGQFDAFSGATITPRTVVSAIHSGLEFFSQHQTALLVLEANGSTLSDGKGELR